jgi:hypothetical protein
MSWRLPTALPPVAGLLAFVLSWPRLRVRATAARLLSEVVLLTLASIALVWLGWVVLWWIEQRW